MTPQMSDFSERLRLARERAGYADASAAIEAYRLTPSTYYGHENGDRMPRLATIKEYARLYNVPYDWLLDGMGTVKIGLPETITPSPNASQPLPTSLSGRGAMLPVYGVARGGSDGRFAFNGEVVDRLPRPPILANVANAYCVFVAGDSMEPRYYAGETIYVHPARPIRKGNFVVVQLQPAQQGEAPEGYVKQFVAWAGNDLVLRQFNPDGEIRFHKDSVLAVHRIVLSGDDA